MADAELPDDLWQAYDKGEDACWTDTPGHGAEYAECCKRTGLAAALTLHEQQVRERVLAEVEQERQHEAWMRGDHG